MSYVFKQPVTENQVKESVTARQNQAALDALKSSIEQEESARANADANFSLQINQLQENLAAEVASRGSDTAILAADLATEKNLRTAADFTLETLINAEIADRNAAESNLRDEMNNALESEQAARSKEVADAIAALKVAMGDDKALEAIENEKLREQIQEAAANQSANLSALESRLAAEELNRASDVTAVRAEIAAEINARTNANSQLQNALTAALNSEITDRKAAVSGVETALDNAQKNLNAALDSEIADRKTAIGGVETALDNAQKNLSAAINGETADRKSAISGVETALANAQKNLNAALNGEIADRKAAISSVESKLENAQINLNAAINKEVEERKTAIGAAQTALQNSISESAQKLRDDFNSETATTRAYIDAQISAVEGNLNDFTAPTATADGTRGLVPAPPAKMFNGILTTRGWRTPDDTTLTIANTPAQVGVLTFNRSEQSPSWINFDEKKLKIEGTTSASDAGVYTVTFTPLDIYLWADTLDQQPKTATWQIGALKLAKPSAAVTNFVYNRVAQGISPANFDATYESQSGDISATDAAVYRAVFALKNKSNTHWSDDSTDDVVINWQIQPLLLTKPTAAVTEFTFDTAAKNLAVDNFDSVYESQTGKLSATDAGNYTAIYQLKNKSNTHWEDDTTADVQISWKISPMLLKKPTAAVTEFTYDSSTKTLDAADFIANFESQAGISAVDAGNYTATFALKSKTNTHWADDSVADVSIDWKIKPLLLKKPTAAVTEFTFDGAAKSLEVADVNADYESQTGTISATNAAAYTATYKLKNTNNTHWSDNSTADVNINWKIKPKLLAKPIATVDAFTFDGAAKTVQVTAPAGVTQSGTATATNAGSYSVTYKLSDAANTHWADDSTADISIDWKIEKLKLAKPTAAVTEFAGDGADKTLDVSNFNAQWMTESGTKTASASGDYSVSYSLKDAANTCWEDDSTDDVVIDWKINLTVLTYAQSTGFKQVGTLTYNGLEQSPEINNFNAEYLELSSQTVAIDAGSYTLQITPKESVQWYDKTTDAKEVTWKIGKKYIEAPTFEPDSFLYDGTPKTARLKGYDSDVMVLMSGYSKLDASGDTLTATNVGRYFVGFMLISTDNYAWVGSSGVRGATLRITADPVAKPTCGATQFTFDGTEKSITINGFDSDTMRIAGTTAATDAGDYTAIVKLTNPRNINWDDGTIVDVEFYWNIARKKLTKAQSQGFAQDGSLTFDNTNQTVTVKNFDAAIHTLGGTFSAKSAGTYTAQISPGKNYCWYEGDIDAKDISWTIKKLGLNYPYVPETWWKGQANPDAKGKTYDGKPHSIELSEEYDSKYMKLSGDTSATLPRNWEDFYWVNVDLIFPDDTFWAQFPRTNFGRLDIFPETNNGTLILPWGIDFARIPADFCNLYLTQDNFLPPALNTTFYVQPYIANFDATYHVLGGTVSVTPEAKPATLIFNYKIGTYTSTVTPKEGYAWDSYWTSGADPQQSFSFTWQIVPRSVPAPYATVTEFEFDGQNHTLDVQNFDSDFMTRTGTVTAKNIGKYSVTFNLKSWNPLAWSTGGTDAIVIEWSIGLSKIAAPVLTSANFTFDGNAHEATFDGVDSAKMSISGTTQATNAGSYSVTFSLTDKNTYCWDDGSNDDRVYIWKINRQTLPANKSTFSQAGTLDYNAQTQTVTIQNYDPNFHTLGGTYNAVDAGTYTARIFALPNYQFSGALFLSQTVSWTINPIKLVKPTVAVTNFTYDKNAHELQVSNFNDTYESRTGTISATNEGSYSVTFSLKNKTSTTWADGSTADITVAWNIAKVRVPKPYFTVTELTFKTAMFGGGVSQSVDGYIRNFDENFMTQEGTTSARNAGSYSVTFALKDKDLTVWEDGSVADVVINWNINRAKVSGDANNPYQSKDFTYSGNEFSIINKNYLAGYDAYAHVWSGDFKATNAGEYTAYVKPGDNYVWADDTTTQKTVNWKIERAQIAAPTVSGTLTFNENEQSPTLSGYDANAMTLSGDTAKTDAGDYTLVVTPDSNHCWTDGSVDSINLSWQIKPIVVPLPEWRNYHDQTWTLGKYSMTPPKYADTDDSWLNNVKNYDAAIMTTGGNGQTKAGTYNVTFTLNNGYSFSNSGIVRTARLSWTVNKLRIVADMTKGTLEYTGEQQYLPQFSEAELNVLKKSGTYRAKEIGNYSAEIGISSATFYRYQYELEVDGVLIEYPNTYTFGWSIGVAAITAPSLAFTPTPGDGGELITKAYFGYDGQAHAPEILNFDSATMTKSGVESATEAGFYQITFALKDKEKTCWSTGGAEDIVLEWGIGLAKVKKPSGTESEQTYDGTVKYAGYSGWNVNFATLTGHSATDAGTYTARISLISRYNTQYIWDDGSRDDVTWTWKINPKPLPEVSFSATNFTFDRNEHAAVINNFDAATMTAAGDLSATNAGTYSVQISPKSNYCWADGSTAAKTVSWSIAKKIVTFPYAPQKTFDYTGKTITPDVWNFDSDWADKAGIFSATASGTYQMIFTLKDTANSRWAFSGVATDPITINWTIGSQILAVPTVSPASQVSKGINESHSVTLSGFNSAVMAMTGDTSVNSGKPATYTLTFSLKDKEHSQWDDGSTADKKVTWQVTKKVLTLAESTFAQDSPLVWEDSNVWVYYYQFASALKAEYFGKYYCPNIDGLYKNVKPNTWDETIELTDAACWYDGSTAAKKLTVTVDKAQFPYELSAGGNVNVTAGAAASIRLCQGDNWSTFVRKAVSDGKLSITATSSNPDVLTIQTNVFGNITLGVVKNGAATVTVKLSSDYYVVPETITYNYTVARPLELLPWSEIAELASAGTLSQYANIGDSVKVAVKGTVGTLDIDGIYNAVLIGIDHNAAREGSNRAHFAVLNAFTDKFYNTDVNGLDDADKAFAFSSYSNNGEEHLHFYNESIIRNRCTEFFNALPAELRTAISPVRKPFYGTNITQNADGSNSYTPYFSYTNDNVFIPSPFEVFGKTVNSHGQSAYYQQYDYWANGNSANFGKNYWLRDRDFEYVNTASFGVAFDYQCYANDSGALSMSGYLDRSYGLIFCFSVGG